MATYYLGATGSDSTGAGTIGNPYLTITKANTVASNGDTVICLNGTYTWVSSSITKTLNIQAQTNGSVFWDAGTSSATWTFGGTSLIYGITGMVFQSNTNTNNVFATSGASSASLTFNNCLFKTITLSSTSICFFRIGTSTSNFSITFNNCILNNIKGAVPLVGLFGTGEASGVLVFNNTTIYCLEPTNRVSMFLQSFGGNWSSMTIKNSIIVNDTGSTLSMNMTPTTQTYSYSCMRNLTGFSAGGAGMITSDPLFVDAGNGNFNLRPQSPCVDSGTLV